MESAERLPLRAVGIEVGWIEPGFESGFARGPLAVEHGEPGGVAVAALDHHVLPEDALVGEAEAFGGAATGLVLGVALPLVAAIAEFEDMASHEVHGFGGGGGAL